DAVSTIIVAGPAEPQAFAEFRQRYADKLGLLGVKLCQGGKTHRYETVKAALALVPGDVTHSAVHDAARPCTPQELLDRVLDAASKYAAVIPGVDVPDTLKKVGEREVDDRDVDPLDAILGSAGKKNTRVREVEVTVDRARLIAVQTPQIFKAELLRRGVDEADLGGTDESEPGGGGGRGGKGHYGGPRDLGNTGPARFIHSQGVCWGS